MKKSEKSAWPKNWDFLEKTNAAKDNTEFQDTGKRAHLGPKWPNMEFCPQIGLLYFFSHSWTLNSCQSFRKKSWMDSKKSALCTDERTNKQMGLKLSDPAGIVEVQQEIPKLIFTTLSNLNFAWQQWPLSHVRKKHKSNKEKSNLYSCPD